MLSDYDMSLCIQYSLCHVTGEILSLRRILRENSVMNDTQVILFWAMKVISKVMNSDCKKIFKECRKYKNKRLKTQEVI